MRETVVIAVCALMSFIPKLRAETETVDGYEWTYSCYGDEIEIDAISPEPTGEVVIPSSLGGKPVTNIGMDFQAYSDLVGVTIPDSVTSLGWWAFQLCSSLTSVRIPDGVTYIGRGAFGECSSLTNVVIGSGLYEIDTVWPESYFAGCSSLLAFEVDVGNPSYKSVNGLFLTKDGETLLAGINGNVVIPDGVRTIVSTAFDRRYGLTTVTIPESVTEVGSFAFCDCSSLSEIRIPSQATSIGEYAFCNCSGLKDVVIFLIA